MAELQSNMFRKIFIMIWKNFLLRKRHYIQTALEIILPTLLFVILVAIHTSGDTPNSTSVNGTNEVQADIPPPDWYPIDYCESLRDMMESADKNDDNDKQNLTVLAREIYFTNVPENQNVNSVQASRLVRDIMNTVQKTVNYFLVPCCSILAEFDSKLAIQITEEGILSKKNLFLHIYRYFVWAIKVQISY